MVIDVTPRRFHHDPGLLYWVPMPAQVGSVRRWCPATEKPDTSSALRKVVALTTVQVIRRNRAATVLVARLAFSRVAVP